MQLFVRVFFVATLLFSITKSLQAVPPGGTLSCIEEFLGTTTLDDEVSFVALQEGDEEGDGVLEMDSSSPTARLEACKMDQQQGSVAFNQDIAFSDSLSDLTDQEEETSAVLTEVIAFQGSIDTEEESEALKKQECTSSKKSQDAYRRAVKEKKKGCVTVGNYYQKIGNYYKKIAKIEAEIPSGSTQEIQAFFQCSIERHLRAIRQISQKLKHIKSFHDYYRPGKRCL